MNIIVSESEAWTTARFHTSKTDNDCLKYTFFSLSVIYDDFRIEYWCLFLPHHPRTRR